MSIFSKFRKGKNEDPAAIAKRVQDASARAEDKLPPPNLVVSFRCECDRWLSFNLNNFNSLGGVEVMCVSCGVVTLLPPEILDHTAKESKIAALKPDWQQMVRIVRHRRNNGVK